MTARRFHISIEECFDDGHAGDSWNYDADSAAPSEALERVAAELRCDDGSFLGSVTPVEQCDSIVVTNVGQLRDALTETNPAIPVFTVRPDGIGRPILLVDDPDHGFRVV